jgi:hypothetical protein
VHQSRRGFNGGALNRFQTNILGGFISGALHQFHTKIIGVEAVDRVFIEAFFNTTSSRALLIASDFRDSAASTARTAARSFTA